MGGGQANLLQYYMGGGSAETPKLYYVIYEQPLALSTISLSTLQYSKDSISAIWEMISWSCETGKEVKTDVLGYATLWYTKHNGLDNTER